jgi:hypothetical protein
MRARPNRSHNSPSQSKAATRPGAATHQIKPTSPSKVDTCSPLVFWRTRPADAFVHTDVLIIRRALRNVGILGECNWPRAMAGDASAAIGIAVRIMRSESIRATVVDLTLSAVLCCALEDSPAAKLVLAAALRRLAKIDPPAMALSSLWLVH